MPVSTHFGFEWLALLALALQLLLPLRQSDIASRVKPARDAPHLRYRLVRVVPHNIVMVFPQPPLALQIIEFCVILKLYRPLVLIRVISVLLLIKHFFQQNALRCFRIYPLPQRGVHGAAVVALIPSLYFQPDNLTLTLAGANRAGPRLHFRPALPDLVSRSKILRFAKINEIPEQLPRQAPPFHLIPAEHLLLRTVVFLVFLHACQLRCLEAPTFASKCIHLLCIGGVGGGKHGGVRRSSFAMSAAQILQPKEDLIMALLQPVLLLSYLLQLRLHGLRPACCLLRPLSRSRFALLLLILYQLAPGGRHPPDFHLRLRPRRLHQRLLLCGLGLPHHLILAQSFAMARNVR